MTYVIQTKQVKNAGSQRRQANKYVPRLFRTAMSRGLHNIVAKRRSDAVKIKPNL